MWHEYRHFFATPGIGDEKTLKYQCFLRVMAKRGGIYQSRRATNCATPGFALVLPKVHIIIPDRDGFFKTIIAPGSGLWYDTLSKNAGRTP